MIEGPVEQARGQMQAGLLRHVIGLMTLAAAGLALRELVAGGPVHTALFALAVGAGAAVVARRREEPPRLLGFAFFCALVALITNAAFALGGAAGSALSFAFIPGFLGGLVLGPRWGWAVCATMLACFGWLHATTALPTRNDELRFIDEVAMTVFATGLAHALGRSFDAYEAAAAERRALLLSLREEREAMTLAIYEELEPLASGVVAALGHDFNAMDRRALGPTLDRLIQSLRNAKALGKKDAAESPLPGDPDKAIRAASMRLWLRLAAALMLFFVARNLIAGAPFAPSLITFVACIAFDYWLTRPAAAEHLEATALAIGLVSTGPMVLHIHSYGVSPEAPPLVVTPATVLFTALLSHGPASWAVLALNVGVVAWTGLAKSHLTLTESRLLGDLALSFAVLVVALRFIFALRLRYTRALLEQGKAVALALRQQRRLAGTLFHDVSNHLQALMLLTEFVEPAEDFATARSLAHRVARLIGLTKGFLLSSPPEPELPLEPVSVEAAVAAVKEAFALPLAGKRLRLETDIAPSLRVFAQPDLLVESVLGNLMSNAVKFSPPDGVIELSAERKDGFVLLVVADAGPGLPEEVVRKLGEDGALPSRLGTAGERGQGYGLKLAEEHLQRIGGRLELKAREGGGTLALIWLRSA